MNPKDKPSDLPITLQGLLHITAEQDKFFRFIVGEFIETKALIMTQNELLARARIKQGEDQDSVNEEINAIYRKHLNEYKDRFMEYLDRFEQEE